MNFYLHPSVICETNKIGENTRIWTFTHIQNEVEIGRDVNIGGYCFIESGSRIGDGSTIKNGVSIWRNIVIGNNCFIGPNVVFTNDLFPRSVLKKNIDQLLTTYVEDGATIGANATINPGLKIGLNSFVGSGSVVVRDVKNYSKVVGNPAKEIGWICKCSGKIKNLTCQECQKKYIENNFGLSEII